MTPTSEQHEKDFRALIQRLEDRKAESARRKQAAEAFVAEAREKLANARGTAPILWRVYIDEWGTPCVSGQWALPEEYADVPRDLTPEELRRVLDLDQKGTVVDDSHE